ncbi:MAG: SAM-dependent methyltransferase, partial [Acidimicrobiia bacterium]
MTQERSTGELEKEIVELIRTKGPITFFEFMDIALYHPLHGFYSSPRRGPGIDYRTSPTLTPAFGTLLVGAFDQMKGALGTDFLNVVEIGGGTGQLAEVVLESRKDFRWTFVERFATNEHAQRRAVWGGRGCSWAKDLSEVEPFVGCMLANEVLDNFPVHVFEKSGTPLEVFVEVENDRLVESLREPSSAELMAWAERVAAPLVEGQRFELRPGIQRFAEQASEGLLRGYVLVLDYGDEAPALQLENPEGTVVTYRNEILGADPLDSSGHADITAHVDFTQLRNELERRGFEQISVATQREFLRTLGIEDLEISIEKQRRAASSEGRHADFVSLTAEKGRLHALRSGGSLG